VRLGRENLPPPPLPDLVGLSDLIVLRGPAATVCCDLSPCLDVRKFCFFNVLHTVARFVCLWQILFYHGLTRLKRFVSRSTLVTFLAIFYPPNLYLLMYLT
jgi:hypothetical protein